MPLARYGSGTCSEGLSKTVEILGQDSQCLSRDSNRADTEHEYMTLSLDQPTWATKGTNL
jgi:hypothetical protein